MPAVTKYIQRVSWLLRQGEPANQVAVLLPTDDAWAGFSPAHVSVSGAMQKLIAPELMSAILSAGYNVDYIDSKAIDAVGLGTHQVLVIPPMDRIPVGTVKKINEFIATGGKVVMVGRVPTMDAEGRPLGVKLSEKIPVVGDYASLGRGLPDAVKPDLMLPYPNGALRNSIGFARRKLPNEDVYFISNTSNQPIDTTVKLASAHKFAEQWDPDSGVAYRASAYQQSLNLGPYESRVVVFSDQDAGAKHEETAGIVVEGDPSKPSVIRFSDVADLSSKWKIDFVSINKTQDENKLTDWFADPATSRYSGEAIYSRDFSVHAKPGELLFLEVQGGAALPGAPNSLPQEHVVRGADGLPNPLVTGTGPGMHAYFDPPIREAALVFINGKPAGALWHPPYRLDVTKLLKAGTNHIEIHVYNTALNAWSALPPHDYKPLIEKYGDRFQMQDMDKVKPISSGILGTIHLVKGTP
jgi:hypothetical protein